MAPRLFNKIHVSAVAIGKLHMFLESACSQLNLQLLWSFVWSSLLYRSTESCSIHHLYRSHEHASSKSWCLFIEVLTFMVVQGCTLDVKWTNTSEWASALAATSKTWTILGLLVLRTGARSASCLVRDGVDDYPSRIWSCE